MGETARWIAALMLSLASRGADGQATSPTHRPGQALVPSQFASLLRSLHPDYTRYIGTIRYGQTRLRPASVYAGLVRSGGVDPRDPRDAPLRGLGAANDLIIYADTFEPWRSVAWQRLLADHEYFHARHLSGGFPIPLVGFGNQRADADYLEAVAWGYVLTRANEGLYGNLTARESSEVRSHYCRHQERFRGFVHEHQPSAWAHYGRFLPDTDRSIRPPASAPTAGLLLSADPERE